MKHIIEGQEIEVESYACSSMFWFGAGLRVLVNGKEIARSTKKFEWMGTRVPFEIQVGETKKAGVVISDKINSVLRMRYNLFIEDAHIATGCVRAKNWYITYGLILLTAIFMGLLVVLAKLIY